MTTPSSPMKLYIAHGSPNCRKVHAVVEALGLKPELVLLNPATGELSAPSFLEVNPNGKVPALQEGELRLWESNAIMAYLCRRHGPTSLYPEEPAARADVDRWLSWDLAHFGAHLASALFERVFKRFAGAGEPDEDSVGRSLRAWAPYAKVLDSSLSSRPFVCGDAVTIADFSLGSQLALAPYGRLDLAGHPNIRAWLGRLDEVPAWRATAMPEPMRAQLDGLFGTATASSSS
ncbi:MAG: glutathione S-transferase family protein [Nannocystaceae bacterium]|nr:glutathione S-transferase family protein [Nannocystaceae bacterium]